MGCCRSVTACSAPSGYSAYQSSADKKHKPPPTLLASERHFLFEEQQWEAAHCQALGYGLQCHMIRTGSRLGSGRVAPFSWRGSVCRPAERQDAARTPTERLRPQNGSRSTDCDSKAALSEWINRFITSHDHDLTGSSIVTITGRLR